MNMFTEEEIQKFKKFSEELGITEQGVKELNQILEKIKDQENFDRLKKIGLTDEWAFILSTIASIKKLFKGHQQDFLCKSLLEVGFYAADFVE